MIINYSMSSKVQMFIIKHPKRLVALVLSPDLLNSKCAIPMRDDTTGKL